MLNGSTGRLVYVFRDTLFLAQLLNDSKASIMNALVNHSGLCQGML